ncbi:histidinol-phosphate aminotransferase [Candidatus Kinetoplastibacterium desouzaii TCC079E]|uniref:Histidinol-phosphate aminotransferase n=1 Tax=Candidatus Kinetoplastidibacterium desouzai TCC079E TaxID=1208919 RepID=M1LTC0_9PROT|nr:histidinol-phosphate transaminase [Candidatus Kinetoplastibacterium desouzaii]AGF46584.1 histidinol-phosphate aminotransferase [Candidatus Kinetoplastibacterium desouzaii TCC079E]
MVISKNQLDVVNKTIRKDIQSISAYPINNSSGFIKLDAMESPYSLPENLYKKINDKINLLSLNRYPSADKTKLTRIIKENFDIPNEASVLFGNGSDELIHLIIQSCCDPGDVVISPSPSFVYFGMAAKFNHAKFIGVPLTKDFQLNLQDMLDAIEKHKPKVIFLAMPNNPTGNIWDHKQVQSIIEKAPGLVIIDEAYQAFTNYTWMPMITKIPNILVLRTVSKIGLAGLRFGYLSGNKKWINQIDKVRPPYNINVLTELFLIEIINNKNILDQQTKQILLNKESLISELKKIENIIVYPSHGNFVLTRVDQEIGSLKIYEKLKANGILIKNLSGSHELLENCLRISIGTSEENNKLLHVLKTI